MLEIPSSILVINVSRIGDTLLVTPAMRALARAWPQARLTFLGHPKRVEIVRNLPFVAEVGCITKHRARWRGWLPGRRWDLALVFGFDTALVAYALRAARRTLAFRQADAALNAQLFRCVEFPPFQSLHSAKIPLLLTEALGLPDAGGSLSYVVSGAEEAWARNTLAAAVPPGSVPLIGLQVASFPTKAYRDWPLACFKELCDRIVASYPMAHLLIFGGKPERTHTEALAGHFPHRATSFAGSLTLRQTAALMNMLDLYVGVDTGPTHIMGALHRPMIALYHCYSPSRLLAPLQNPFCRAIDHPRAAQGCPPETSMAEISVESVWNAVVEALAAASNPVTPVAAT